MSRVPRVYEVEGRRFRLPAGLDRPPRHWRHITTSRRLREQPPPLRSVSAEDLALTVAHMRAVSIIQATEIPPRHKSHLKYSPFFEQIRALKLGQAAKFECDDAIEARKFTHAIRQQFQSTRAHQAPSPVLVQCQYDTSTHTVYVTRVATMARRTPRAPIRKGA